MKTLCSICLMIFGSMFAYANSCDQEKIDCFQQQNENTHFQLETQFLEAMELIEGSSQLIKGSEALFLFGEPGSGKSTVFNWLMGKKILGVKNEQKRPPKWEIEVEYQDKTHKIEQNLIPSIGQALNGLLLVDFPGWDNSKGWQYNLVNQFILNKSLETCKEVKILFIFDYQYFETKRGTAIKEIIQQIQHIGNETSIDKSAMFLINKVYFQDETDDNWEELKQNYLESLRNDFAETLDQSSDINEQTKTMIANLIQNDIYIMKNAGQKKQQYTKQEVNQLWSYIDKLESVPLKFKLNITEEIQNKFTTYFTTEMNSKQERINHTLKYLKDVYQNITNGSINRTSLIPMYQDIEQFKNQISQNPNNWIATYDALEKLYQRTMELTNKQNDSYVDQSNLKKIYNFFFPYKLIISAYKENIFNNLLFQPIGKVQKSIQDRLKDKQFQQVQELEQIKQKYDNLLKEHNELKEKVYNLEEIRKEQNRFNGRLLRIIINQDRSWWQFWKPNKIPDWIRDEDVDDYIHKGC